MSIEGDFQRLLVLAQESHEDCTQMIAMVKHAYRQELHDVGVMIGLLEWLMHPEDGVPPAEVLVKMQAALEQRQKALQNEQFLETAEELGASDKELDTLMPRLQEDGGLP
jgi:hypothetical protein